VYPVSCIIHLTGGRLRAVSHSRLPQTIEPHFSRISTSCESDPEPNLHPPAHDSRLGWSRQVTHLGKPLGRKTRTPNVIAKLSSKCPRNQSTTSYPAACSHPRPAFGCRPKGDQPAPGCRLGVEGPKGGEMKEKVEETRLERASKRLMAKTFRT
jgi:hypothetical protein